MDHNQRPSQAISPAGHACRGIKGPPTQVRKDQRRGPEIAAVLVEQYWPGSGHPLRFEDLEHLELQGGVIFIWIRNPAAEYQLHPVASSIIDLQHMHSGAQPTPQTPHPHQPTAGCQVLHELREAPW